MDNTPSAAKPQICPLCATEQPFEESVDHDSRDNGDLEFRWECTECGGQFTTIKQLENTPPQNHTLMWSHDAESGGVEQVLHVPHGEDAPQTTLERAELNIRKGKNYEVHGREWAIERLFELFDDNFDLPVSVDT